MHAEFKAWLIKDSDRWTPEQKQSFLKMMKSEPEKVVRIISANLTEWCTVFVFKAGTPVYCDIETDAQELFKAYQEHFRAELNLAPQQG